MRRWALVPPAIVVSLALLLGPGEALAQVPPDTVPPAADTAAAPDTTQAAPDSLAAVPDSLRRVPGDSLQEVADSAAAADTVPGPVTLLPAMPRPVPASWATGVWEWDRQALLSTRALTLAQLLAEIPGTLALRAGDIGTPNAVTAFGAGGGRVRVFQDGWEILPLEGGVLDLSRVGLSGLERVRVTRGAGEFRVDLEGLEVDDPRAYSLVETGTGDLNTNFFRGTFSHPNALGGGAALALDRVDTEGVRREQPGAMTGGWVRYTRNLGDRLGLRAELRTMTSSRPDDLFDPAELRRTDWTVRGRLRLADGLLAEGFWGRSSLTPDAPAGDTIEPPSLRRSQAGGRLAFDRGGLFGEAGYRSIGGDAWPESSVEARGGFRSSRWGGVEAAWERQSLDDVTAASTRLLGWVSPLPGLTFFAETTDGDRGVPGRFVPFPVDTLNPPPDTVEIPRGDPFVTNRKTLRVGGELRWRRLELGGARLRLEADSLAPLGLAMDSTGLVVGGGERNGWEAYGSLPLYFTGLSLDGSYQRWEENGADWRYLPRETWRGALSYHNTFLPTGNFEIWTAVGVSGRERMVLPFAGPGTPEDPALLDVPFYQSWYFRLQMRIVVVNIFVVTENLAARTSNQDFPDRPLPGIRSVYGVRWTLWN